MTNVAAKKAGSVLGGMLLIAGSCIGAGMLGLPIATGPMGFFPSLVMFMVACLFMTSTALLLVEINSWYKRPVNFITMVSDLLGPYGRLFCWILYLFLFYALLVAYIAGSGSHFTNICEQYFSFSIPSWVGSTLFVGLFGALVYLGTLAVDMCNRFLMLAKIVVYLGLLLVGVIYIQPKMLEYVDVKYMPFSLPILIISFGFHNMIPTLSDYLGGDVKRVKKAIITGAVFALLIYLFWQVIVLGSIPIQGENGVISSYLKGQDAAVALNELLGSYWISTFSTFLAFFAILTSFIAQALSLVHFLADGMEVARKGKREPIAICVLALLPPLLFAAIYPQIFYKALNFAGGVCAVILFGMFPALMVWLGRKNQDAVYRVRGGKALLVFIFCFATFIFINQVAETLGHPLFAIPGLS
ncbi:MAG: amino acid permease [Chlamydiae bacterium]|nr:amino acid permease [Chlamydiota bacterium]